MTNCPDCHAPWQPHDIRGVLYWQHSPACRYEPPEIQTQTADNERLDELDRDRAFTRPITPTEAELLTALGYAPTTGTPWVDDKNPGTLACVTWTGSIRRRTFPNLTRPAGLPDPAVPWPPPTQTPPPATPRKRWPGAW